MTMAQTDYAARDRQCQRDNHPPKILHSVGAFGWYAWIDHEHEYYGVFAHNNTHDVTSTLWILCFISVAMVAVWSYWVTKRSSSSSGQKKENNKVMEEASVVVMQGNPDQS